MKKISFDKSYKELQTILLEIQSDNISIDSLAEKVKKSTVLIKQCQEKLRSIELEVDSILEE